MMPDRQGWPEWAVTRTECCNCGRFSYHPTPPPPQSTPAYDEWLKLQWPQAQSMLTNWGFRVWHDFMCRRQWMAMRTAEQHHGHDGWANEHRRAIDKKLLKSGLGT